MRVLELFSGIGGWRLALQDLGEVVAAYDISPAAALTYALNHGEVPIARELASVPGEVLLGHGADVWVMSPPCQPFCRMGNRHGLEDARSRAFLALMDLFRISAPRALVLENVLGFEGSDAHELLLERLRQQGFHHREFRLCPTAFGIPNQRPRFFLIAAKGLFPGRELARVDAGTLAPFLDPREDEACYLDGETLSKHAPGMDFVIPEDRRSTCFIGGYGQRYVGSGSFLATPRGVRRFSPAEIARIMGLPVGFRFPEFVGRSAQYKLLGNGLSIPVARWVLQHLESALR
jgi:site-specific DNA-cytosine methylase